MGWAAEDKETVDQAKTDLSISRSTLYLLGKTLNDVIHVEKKDYLMKLYGQASQTLDEIDRQLNR